LSVISNNPSLLTIVVPAFNEAENLPQHLPKLLQYAKSKNFKVILVDDCSKDSTFQLAHALFLEFPDTFEIIRHKVNRGYGGALKTGLSSVKSDFAITVDADGQHRIDDIQKLFEAIQEEQADMIIGRRQAGSDNFFRGLGKKIIRFFSKLVLPHLNITDLNSGLKIYKTRLVKKFLPVAPNGMSFSDSITLYHVKNFYHVIEVDVQVEKRLQGRSTISVLTAVETLWRLLIIAALFNPMRIFLPLASALFIAGVLWGLPFLLQGHGVTTGALLLISMGMINLAMGVLAELLSILITKEFDS
jgi:glycosyltransferase involved in cell wall biosynthesis